MISIQFLPKLSQYLDREATDTFFQLLDRSITSKPFFSSSEKRAFKRQLTHQLNENNVDNARSIADLLIDIGIYDDIDFCLSLVKHPKPKILMLLLLSPIG
jgi:hypothetical protein